MWNVSRANVIFPAVFVPIVLAGVILSFTGHVQNPPVERERAPEAPYKQDYQEPQTRDLAVMVMLSKRSLSGIRVMQKKLSERGNLSRADWERLLIAEVINGEMAAHYNDQVAHVNSQTLAQDHLPMEISERVP